MNNSPFAVVEFTIASLSLRKVMLVECVIIFGLYIRRLWNRNSGYDCVEVMVKSLFNNKVVMITGASGGLGKAVTQVFYDSGASLVLGDRHPERQADQFGNDPRVLLHAVDLMVPKQTEAIVHAAVERFGKVDVLANTVGGFRMSTIQNTTPEQWDFMMNLNLRTAFLISRSIIPQMVSQGFGSIIHVSARRGLSGSAKLAAYSASKSGLIRLVESLSAEVKDAGITVNCVLPGTIDTPDNRAAMPNADISKWVAPEAIAEVIMFLASNAGRAVTGAALPVYGRT